MSESTVTPDVRRLLEQHVESYEQLEIILLMHRTRDVQWNADALGHSLHIPTTSAASALIALHRSRIVSTAPGPNGTSSYVYAPTSAADVSAIDQLSEDYAVQRIEIIKLMNANALLRVRTSALRAFADAFDLRKGPKDG
ncbi:MAG TPA: hypothetical protein VGM84_04830 [Steroidobacteraceae bacterium]